MMTSEISKKSPETIEDLKNQNYTVVASDQEWIYDFMQTIPNHQRPQLQQINASRLLQLLVQQLTNSSAKLAFFLLKNNKFTGVRLKQEMVTSVVGLCMRSNIFLFWLAEDTIQHLNSGGIPQHLIAFYDFILGKPKPPDSNGPKVLLIDDLSYGFIIWICSCSTTILAFFGEFLWKYLIVKVGNWLKNKLKKIFWDILFVILLRYHLKSKQRVLI